MNRVVVGTDGKLIEYQSGGADDPIMVESRLNVLKQNAMNAGYKEDEFEVKMVTDEELYILLNPPPTIEEVVNNKHREIDKIRDKQLAKGVPFNFPDVVGTIQTRDERDFRNILGRVVAGIVLTWQDVKLPFRDEEDNTHELTPLQAVTMGLVASNYGTDAYKAAWAHKGVIKKMVEEGATVEQVEQYDITTGWPET